MFIFTRTLTDEQRSMKDAIILFSVKDKDYFGMANQYVADAFLMLSDITDISQDSGSIKQMHLKLTRPQNENEGKFPVELIKKNRFYNFIFLS